MAEADNPCQNAHAESFWARLKAELLEDGYLKAWKMLLTTGSPVRLFNYIKSHRGVDSITSVGSTHR